MDNRAGLDEIKIDVLIAQQAVKYPDKVAIQHNGQSITYRELDIRSNQVATWFAANNINGNDIVAVVMDRSIKLAVCLLGIIKTGAAYLPIDPNLPADRVNFILKDCKVKVLCTTIEYVDLYQNDDKILFDDVWLKRHIYPVNDLNKNRKGSDLAYILYTSGSTGFPKGVAIEHHSLINFLLSIQKSPGISKDDIMLSISTISFDIAQLEFFLPLISGAKLIIVDNDVAKDGRALLGIIKAEQISIVQATPFTWRMLLQSGWPEILPIKAFCGGEAMSKDLAHKLLGKCLELWNMYGPTETTIYSLIKKIAINDEVITIGKPIDNTTAYVLDKDQNQVTDGEEGEIYIGGYGVAREYICRPELTEERFIADKFAGDNSAKIYKTGDWGRVLNNGEIQYLGRIDHQIKIRGYRIETDEIEYQIKQLKGVKETVIILHEDRLENKQLVAYVVAKKLISHSQRDEQTRQWKSALKAKLPGYMVPSSFIIIPKIPLMPNGKLDRKMLPPPMPKPLSSINRKPRTETEIAVTQIFLKNTSFENIGINDNFIDLGIDSLIALMIIVDIEEKFDKRFPLTVLVHHPTIQLLAKFISSASTSPYNPLIPLKKEGSKLPLYLVHGIGLNLFNFNSMVTHLDADQPVYGLRAAGLDGNLEPLRSIEQLAAYYNQEIINHDPIGPYAIAGYSAGGVIAYEMVKQLKQAGKQVEMLAMFDTNIQDINHQMSLSAQIKRKIARQFNKLIFRVKSFSINPIANIIYLKDMYMLKAKKYFTSAGLRNKNAPSELPEYMQKVVDNLEAALNKYTLTPYHVKIDLIKAQKRFYYVDDPKLLGWETYALDGIHVYDVPGDHKEIFFPPNHSVLADTLTNILDQMPANMARGASPLTRNLRRAI